MDVTDQTFDDLVVERSTEVPVVVDFWASWCGPCLALAPVLEGEIEARGGTVELAKVDVDANPELARRFGVSGIPAVKAFRGGRVVSEFVGAVSPTAVSTFFDGLVAPPRAETIADELRSCGELPDVVARLDADDLEGALDVVLEALPTADETVRDRLREVAVAIYDTLGPDEPFVVAHRRRLATLLY